ncbi:uncharacterized protein LOC126825643 isoform X2 [Patella vulgata]|uniref:uncharacterized protein LOC126825643 isoform X2 n=1 Tax=Patella vulgata TaxID=6465 RepID=UPI00217F9B74|nr:uncharacterized protein LOC126825643 isoform X2 [Patella vulgata]
MADRRNSILEIAAGVIQEDNTTLNRLVDVITGLDSRFGNTEKHLNIIDDKLNKLDEVYTILSNISSKVNKLESDMNILKMKQVEQDTCIHIMADSNRKLQQSLEENRTKIAGLCERVSDIDNTFRTVNGDLNSMRTDHDSIRDTLIDLQCRSMKYNLIFNGLREDRDEDSHQTEFKLQEFINRELKIDHHVELGNVHRFGRHLHGRHRPVGARFLCNNDLQFVKSRAYKLKGSTYGINEQYPEVIESERRKLYPIIKQLKLKGHRTRLVRDKLFVNNEPYNAGTHSGVDPPKTFGDRPMYYSRPWEGRRPPAKRHAHFSSSSNDESPQERLYA